jgi:hypothetical protein
VRFVSVRTRIALGVIAALFASRGARGAEREADEARAPLPEPLLTETVTDIDSVEANEVELEANGALLRSRRGGAYSLDTSLEVEWVVHPRLGVRVEPAFGSDRDPATKQTGFGVGAGAAFKLVQDFERQIFLHLELVGRLPWDESTIIAPGDPQQPFAVDLRAAIRRGAITVRGGAGYGAFGDAEHVPLRGSLAVLTPFDASGRFGFFGVELDADGARRAPFVVALNIEPNLVPIDIPLRLGLGVPLVIDERDDRPSLGIFLRVFYESAREIEFARSR